MTTGDTLTPNIRLTKIAPDRNNWADTLNEDLTLIDAVVGTYFEVNTLRGAWANSTDYVAGDTVADSDLGSLWQCRVPHTSAATPTTFAEDRADHTSYWTTIAVSPSFRGIWSSGTFYENNDFVTESGNYYVCKIAHTSGTFATDLAALKWELLVDIATPLAAAVAVATAASAASAVASAASAVTSGNSATASAASAVASAASAVAAATSEANASKITQIIKNAAHTTILTDAGKHLYHNEVTARTWTIDSNANVAYDIGTVLTFVNAFGSGNITIAITADTMYLGGVGTTGSRTLIATGQASALKVEATVWIITGAGLL